MEKPKILENRRINKGLFRVVLQIDDLTISGYVDDDGNYEDLCEIDKNGNEVEFKSSEEKTQFYFKYVEIFEEMELNYEIGFGGPEIG